MNIKLIVASVLGVGSLGGAAGYYFLKSENTTKSKDSETKSSESLDTNKETTPDLQTQPNSETNNLKTSALPSASAPKEPGPDSRPTTSAEPLATGSVAPRSSVGDNSLAQRSEGVAQDVQRAVET